MKTVKKQSDMDFSQWYKTTVSEEGRKCIREKNAVMAGGKSWITEKH